MIETNKISGVGGGIGQESKTKEKKITKMNGVESNGAGNSGVKFKKIKIETVGVRSSGIGKSEKVKRSAVRNSGVGSNGAKSKKIKNVFSLKGFFGRSLIRKVFYRLVARYWVFSFSFGRFFAGERIIWDPGGGVGGRINLNYGKFCFLAQKCAKWEINDSIWFRA